jgi:methionine--tRNA ligase beta chain
LFDRLFSAEAPGAAHEGKIGVERPFLLDLNPKSLEVVTAKVEPSLAGEAPGARFQFERLGYFCVDPDSKPQRPVFNRTVALKDTWAKEQTTNDPATRGKGADPGTSAQTLGVAPPVAEIDFSDFTKVTLKAGRVLAAEKVEKADKLLKLLVDVGEAAPRTIVSGIAEAFAPDQLIGRNVVVVTNLKPRALKGVESRGMILAAGKGKSLALVNPGDVAAGTDVK